MALSLIQHKIATSNVSGTTVAVTVTALTAGSLVIAGCDGSASLTVSSVADNTGGGSNSYVQVSGARATDAAGRWCDVWYAVNVSSGATTVTLTVSGTASTNRRTIEIWEVGGAATASPVDVAAVLNSQTGTGTGIDAGASVTTTNANDIIVGICRTAGGATTEASTDTVFTFDDSTSGGSGHSHVIVSSTGTYHPIWQDVTNSSSYCASTVAFKAGAAAASFRDTATRFTLASANVFRDTASRFRLAAQAYRDTSARFALRAQTWRDTSTRFRLQTANQRWHDFSTRFRLRSAVVWRDTAARFALQSVATWRDTGARLRLRSATVWRDTAARFKLQAVGTITLLQANPSNYHFFNNQAGRGVGLFGSHTWNTLHDIGLASGGFANIPVTDFNAYVSYLVSNGHNCTFLWHRDLPQVFNWGAAGGSTTWLYGDPWPFPRTGGSNASDGRPQFDLTSFNQTYFDRLRARVTTLYSNNIYVVVQLFDGYEVANNRGTTDGHPYTCNGSELNNTSGGTVDDGYTSGGSGGGAYTMTSANAITAVQDAYVQKVLDTLHDLPNVIYEVQEEGPSGILTWWAGHIISLVHSYEASNGYLPHPVLLPTNSPVSAGGDDSTLFASAADVVAPGDTKLSPTSNTGSKVIINDSDHSYFSMWNDTAQTWRNVLWENFCGGNSYLWMDPYLVYWPSSPNNRNANIGTVTNGIGTTVDPQWANLRLNLGYCAAYVPRMHLEKMTPKGSSSGGASTSYCLSNTASPTREWLVYAPSGGTFTVDLSSSALSIRVEWFDPVAGTFSVVSPVTGGSATQSFTTPGGFTADSVLFLQEVNLYRDFGIRFRLATGNWRDTATRFRLALGNWRDTGTRFRLRAQAWRDTSARFALRSAATYRDTAARLRLQAQAWRDTGTRFKLQTVGQQWRDTATRFRLRSVNTFHDTATRFRLASAAVYRDTGTRFRLQTIGQQWRDTSTRFALRSAAVWRDTATRFRLAIQGYRDTRARFRLRAQAWRDLATRFALQSATVYRDSRLRLRLAPLAYRDTSMRWQVMAASTRDTSMRFALSALLPRDVQWKPGTPGSAWHTRQPLGGWGVAQPSGHWSLDRVQH